MSIATTERIEEVRAATQAALDVASQTAAATAEELAAIADMEAAAALGEVDPDEVDRRREEVVGRLNVAQQEVERQEAILRGLGPRADQAAHETAVAEFEAVAVKLQEAVEERDADAAALGEVLGAVSVDAVRRLKVSREKEHELRVAARAAASAAGMAELEDVDEPSWKPASWAELAAFVAAGPSQPNAVRESQARQRAEEMARADASRVGSVAQHVADYGVEGAAQWLDGLPEHLREAAIERGREITAHRERLHAGAGGTADDPATVLYLPEQGESASFADLVVGSGEA